MVKDKQFEFPTLYEGDRFWKIFLKIDNSGRGYLWTQFGKKDGKITTTEPREIKYQSSIDSDKMYKKLYQLAETKWKNKQILGFKATINKNIPKTILPMGAYDYRKYSHKITFPAYVQVKYDGYRALTDLNTCDFISKRGKPFKNLDHILKEIHLLGKHNGIYLNKQIKTQGLYLDGELVLKSGLHNLKIALSKSDTNLNKELIVYYVFDLLDINHPEMTFQDRWKALKELIEKKKFKYIKLAETTIAKSDKEINKYLKQFLDEGYEGLIVRNKDGIYKLGKRSMDVQKMIVTKWGKFQIVGYKEGSKKQVIWQLKCQKSDRTFWAIPMGTQIFRQQLLKNAKDYIGKMVDVKYFEMDGEGCVTRNPIVVLQ